MKKSGKSTKAPSKGVSFNDIRKTLREVDSPRFQRLEMVGKMQAKKTIMGLSTKELSEKSGLAEDTILSFFQDSEHASVSTLGSLAEALELEIAIADKN